MKVYSKHKLN